MRNFIVALFGIVLAAGAIEVCDEFDYSGVTDVSAAQTNFWEIQVVRQTIQPIETNGLLILQCQNDGIEAGPSIFLKHGTESSWNFFSGQVRFSFTGIDFSGTAADSAKLLMLFVCPEGKITYQCDDGFFLTVSPISIGLNIKKNEGLNNQGDINTNAPLTSAPSRVDFILTPSSYKVIAYTGDGEVILSGNHGMASSDWTLIDGTTPVTGAAVLIQAKKEGVANTNSAVFSIDSIHLYNLPENALKDEDVYLDSEYTGTEYGTENYPYNSLSDLAERAIMSGVNIRLKKNSMFRESCSPISIQGTSENPVVFEGYGTTGDDPVIRGAKVVTGWTDYGGGIWGASVNETVTAFFINGERQILARYPNQDTENDGWLKITAKPVTDPNFPHMLVSTNLKDAAYWTGATCVIRAAAWADSVLTVTNWNNSTKTLYFSENLFADGTKYSVGWGFYMQNVYAEMDADGEWYYDSTAAKLYYKKPSTVDLTVDTAEASVLSSAFALPNESEYIEFRNIQIDCFQEYGLYGWPVSDITVDGCVFKYNGLMDVSLAGMAAVRAENFVIENSVFQNSKNRCINLSNVDGYLINTNTMEDVYQTAVMVGVASDGLIKDNTIRNIGYNGIHISRPIQGNIVERNLIDGFCTDFTDGGAYYAWDGAPGITEDPADAMTIGWSEFKNNIALNGGTNHPANANSGHNCYGIYLDDNSTKWKLTGNIIIEPGNGSLNLHNTRETETVGNLFYGGEFNIRPYESDRYEDWWPEEYDPHINMSDNNIISNVCYINTAPFGDISAVNITWECLYTDPDNMLGTVDYNRYYNPFWNVIDCRKYYTNGTALTGGTLYMEELTLADHQDDAGLNLDNHSVKYAGDTDVLDAEEIGENIVPNFDFSGVIETANCWPRNALTYTNDPDAWVILSKATNVLDGDCLKAVPGDGGGSFWINETMSGNEMAVVSGKTYRIRFTAKAAVKSVLDVDVCQDHDSKLPVGCNTTVTVETGRQEFTRYFNATMDDSDVRILFSMPFDVGEVYVDNLTMKEVVLAQNENSIPLVNTDRDNAATFTLEQGHYVDLDGIPVNTPVSVPAWSAMIVVRKENIVTNSNLEGSFSANGIASGFANNSAGSTVAFSDETNEVFNGSHAQKINCTAIDAGGRVQYNYINMNVHAGNEYTLGAYLKQTGITDDVTLKFGQGAPVYGTFIQQDFSVGTDWKRYEITSYATADASAALFGMFYNSTGILYVDWVTVKQLYNKIDNWSFEEGACTTTNSLGWIRPSFSIPYTVYSAVSDAASGIIAQKMTCVTNGRVQINSEDFDTFTQNENYVIKMKIKGNIGSKTARVNVYARAPTATLEYSYEITDITTTYQEVEIPFTATDEGSSSYFTIVINNGGAYAADVGDYLILDDMRYYHIYHNYTVGMMALDPAPLLDAIEIPVVLNSADFLVRGRQDVVAGGTYLTWSAPAAGLTYTVWYATSLDAPWVSLATLVDDQTNYTDYAHTADSAIFYKVTAE